MSKCVHQSATHTHTCEGIVRVQACLAAKRLFWFNDNKNCRCPSKQGPCGDSHVSLQTKIMTSRDGILKPKIKNGPWVAKKLGHILDDAKLVRDLLVVV